MYSRGLCLNVNDTCSLNCEWCYKKHAPTERSLSYQQYLKFYNSVIKDNIESISLIGGEPTEHKDLIEILSLSKQKNIILNTNGLTFDDIDILRKCVSATESAVRKNLRLTISIKGYTQESYFSTTREENGFNRLCNAIDNIKSEDIPCLYTYVYSDKKENFNKRIFYDFLLDRKIKRIIISDLREYSDKKCSYHALSCVAGYEETIKYLDQKGIEVFARISRPLCIYSKDFIQWLVTKGRLISTCAVKSRNGFFISSNLELIACNQLENCSFGAFETDFVDYKQLCELWDSKAVRDFYEVLSGYPQEKCITCSWWKICGGGCVLNWRCIK